MLHAADGSKGSLLLTGAPWHVLDMPGTGMSTCTAMEASAKESELLFASFAYFLEFPSSQEPEMVTPGMPGSLPLRALSWDAAPVWCQSLRSQCSCFPQTI